MSKFQSTVSTVAALASVFGAGAAGWKLAYENQRVSEPVPEVRETISERDPKAEAPLPVQLPPVETTPPAVPLPAPTTVSPPVTPPPPVPAPAELPQTTP